MKVYTRFELDALRHEIEKARAIMMEASKNLPNEGTCTLGNAIRVRVNPKEFSKSDYDLDGKWFCIIAARGIKADGNCAIYKAMKPALDYLLSRGVECEYYDGVMD